MAVGGNGLGSDQAIVYRYAWVFWGHATSFSRRHNSPHPTMSDSSSVCPPPPLPAAWELILAQLDTAVHETAASPPLPASREVLLAQLQTAQAAHESLRENLHEALGSQATGPALGIPNQEEVMAEPPAPSFSYALLRDVLDAVQRADTADQARAVIHTLNKNILQPAFQFQGEELALAKTALADLCSALLSLVSRTTDPAEPAFTVDKNETLNALLLAWDALHAVAHVSHVYVDIDESTGTAWFDMGCDEDWKTRYGNAVPPSVLGKVYTDGCSRFLVSALTTIQAWPWVTAVDKQACQSYGLLLSLLQTQVADGSAEVLFGPAAGFHHFIAQLHVTARITKDDTFNNDMEAFLPFVTKCCMRMCAGMAPTDAVIPQLQQLWEDMVLFRDEWAPALFGKLAVQLTQCMHRHNCVVPSEFVRVVFLTTGVKVKQLSTLLAIYAQQSEATEAGLEPPSHFCEIVEDLVHARGAEVLPAVIKWVLKTKLCSMALFRGMTRCVRALFTSWNEVPYDGYLVHSVHTMYSWLACYAEVAPYWLEALDVVMWARFRDTDGESIPHPLRAFVLAAPPAVLASAARTLDKLQAEHWTLVDTRRTFMTNALALFPH
jgi:hypothetical protein